MLELPTTLQEFLDLHFQFIESYTEGRVHVYTSPDLRLRIVHDRNGKFFMDVSVKEHPTKDPADWIIFGDLRSYMLNDDDYLTGNATFDEISTFFIDRYNTILDLLKNSYSVTKNALEERGYKRAEVLFGYKRPESKTEAEKKNSDDQKQKKPWWRL